VTVIENASLLRAAANQIDEIDAEIARLNDDKKAIYQNAKETASPADFKAWRDAVKLRQKRRVDRDQMEAHDARVFAMLNMLEASGTPFATRVRVREAEQITEPAAPIPSPEAAVSTGEEGSIAVLPNSPVQPIPHDPETGEITEESDSPASSGAAPSVLADPGESRSAGDGWFETGRVDCWTPPPAPDLTLPDFLDRRKHGEATHAA
jgi:uncharacterized protein (UPF0335 family)